MTTKKLPSIQWPEWHIVIVAVAFIALFPISVLIAFHFAPPPKTTTVVPVVKEAVVKPVEEQDLGCPTIETEGE